MSELSLTRENMEIITCEKALEIFRSRKAPIFLLLEEKGDKMKSAYNEDMITNHGGDFGVLRDFKNDNEKIVTIYGFGEIDTDSMLAIDKNAAINAFRDNTPVYLFNKVSKIDEIENHKGTFIIETKDVVSIAEAINLG